MGVQPDNTGKTPWNKGKVYDAKLKSCLDLSGLEQGRTQGIKRPNLLGDKNYRWKPRIEVICEHCGKKSMREDWRASSTKRHFCNRVCWAKGTRGKGSPVFKGDKASGRFRNRVMQLPEYVEWRTSIFRRDRFTCVLCFEKGKVLNADHHPEPFWSIRDRNEVKTIEDARACLEFWDISKGRTLCLKCHRKTDSYMKKPCKPNKT